MIPETPNTSRLLGEGATMSTDKRRKKRKLSHEILWLFAVCLAVSVVLFLFLIHFTLAIVDNYYWEMDIILSEDDYYRLDTAVLSLGLIVSVVFFIVLFLALFGDRLSYIRTIIKGVDTLRRGELDYRLPIEGNNELTQLAEEINYLSESEQAIKEKERALNEEKEQLIRTLSHDIRTPLTSIMSYTEILASKDTRDDAEMREYLELVGKKAQQIKDLTDILLDGSKRNVEFFEDARLLFHQLVGEFEEVLEADFSLSLDILSCDAFSGSFDTQELRRIFDNLISNVQKYADPEKTVGLSVIKNDSGLMIRQKNAPKTLSEKREGYQLGIYSIRRIAQNYGGRVETRQNDGEFEILITLSVF